MSKKQGYCDNCGGWSDDLTKVYWAIANEYEMYCDSCKRKR